MNGWKDDQTGDKPHYFIWLIKTTGITPGLNQDMVGRKDVSRGKQRGVRKGRKRGEEKHICSLVPLNNKSTES